MWFFMFALDGFLLDNTLWFSNGIDRKLILLLLFIEFILVIFDLPVVEIIIALRELSGNLIKRVVRLLKLILNKDEHFLDARLHLLDCLYACSDFVHLGSSINLGDVLLNIHKCWLILAIFGEFHLVIQGLNLRLIQLFVFGGLGLLRKDVVLNHKSVSVLVFGLLDDIHGGRAPLKFLTIGQGWFNRILTTLLLCDLQQPHKVVLTVTKLPSSTATNLAVVLKIQAWLIAFDVRHRVLLAHFVNFDGSHSIVMVTLRPYGQLTYWNLIHAWGIFYRLT